MKKRSLGPWIWSPAADGLAFVGSAALALAIVAAARLAAPGQSLPPWAFLVLVVGVDVSHVWSTLYRTYFDPAELRKRPLLYAGVPLACFAAGVALHAVSSGVFWTALAYVALFHFIRQQAGWVAIYRARSALKTRLDRVLDDAAIYASTLYPVLVWHTELPRPFWWFVEGDFVPLPIAWAVPWARALYVAILAVYAIRAFLRARATSQLELGKHAVVATTAATWYVGIVVAKSDFEFTAANVIVHGVPYVVLLYVYAREKTRDAKDTFVGKVVGRGVLVFVGILVLIAFVEEGLWDRLVWHDHPVLFGGEDDSIVLSARVLTWIVPLLALPQATHYVLDAVLWRRRDTGAAQGRALGFGGAARDG